MTTTPPFPYRRALAVLALAPGRLGYDTTEAAGEARSLPAAHRTLGAVAALLAPPSCDGAALRAQLAAARGPACLVPGRPGSSNARVKSTQPNLSPA